MLIIAISSQILLQISCETSSSHVSILAKLTQIRYLATVVEFCEVLEAALYHRLQA